MKLPAVLLFLIACASHADVSKPEATPVDRIHVKEGFKVERLYSTPKDSQGSWVAMCVDDKGRLIVSDQYGGLHRLKPPPPGGTVKPGDVEKIEVDIGGAHGLLYAFDALYVVLNTKAHGGRGLYRITDSDGDDKLDKKELLKKFEEKGGEHGPHAAVLGPDGKSIYIVTGNQTALPEYNRCRVPERWAEDLLLGRVIGRGFMNAVEAPRGWIAKTDQDGKQWEIIATGFRNQYDAAFNREGELFTYDADMEWDMNTPWYRPTRINHVVSGAEFGWRNGSGKWPAYYGDSVGAAVDIGPGSPTGVCFGYGAKFPAKYQNAFYAMDWSYGKLYAVHLEAKGASYTGSFEEFIFAQPLPLTDLLIHPQDGAMYFATGGRRVQGGLYRVTYSGTEPTAPAVASGEGAEARKQRHTLEAFHGTRNDAAIDAAWAQLGNADRAIRYAARVALEHQKVERWKARAMKEKDPVTGIQAMMALARCAKPQWGHQAAAISRLNSYDYETLSREHRLDLMRAYTLVLMRLDDGRGRSLSSISNKFEKLFPTGNMHEDIEMCQLLVYVQNPMVAGKAVALLNSAPTQEEQLAHAKSLRMLKAGWTPKYRETYFEWFVRAQTYRGGNSFTKFVENIKKDAVANLPEDQKVALKEIIDRKPKATGPQFTIEPRNFVKNWTLQDLAGDLGAGLEGSRNFARGRNLFGATSCFTCHRFKQEGGAFGPDLSSVSGKFGPRDLLESILEPSKVISDQYNSMIITLTDGTVINGRIINLAGDGLRVNTDMTDPAAITNVDRKKVKSMEESPVSIMPPGLLNTLDRDEILDLLAYLLSGGDPDHPLFK